jgi:hypothetical protein
MNMKIAVVTILAVLAVLGQAKIRILSEKNLEQFAKDNSYWLVQISSKIVFHLRGKVFGVPAARS